MLLIPYPKRDFLESLEIELKAIPMVYTLYTTSNQPRKRSANISALEDAEQDSLVSIYWIARWYDVNIREDKGAISLLRSQDVWFTTWGSGTVTKNLESLLKTY